MSLERFTINFDDFAKYYVKKWKFVLGLIAGFAILFIGATKLFGTEIVVPHSEEYLYYDEKLAWHKEYLTDSVLMSINPTEIHVATALLSNISNQAELENYVISEEIWEDFTTETLQKIQETYKPEQIFIEYNGTWDIATLLETKMPDGWVIVQSLATVDATTFEMYLANMRAMIMEQLFKADVVIFNRCDDNTPKGKFRRAVKAQNRPAQIVYERADGSIDESADEELPFDINADVIDITDEIRWQENQIPCVGI